MFFIVVGYKILFTLLSKEKKRTRGLIKEDGVTYGADIYTCFFIDLGNEMSQHVNDISVDKNHSREEVMTKTILDQTKHKKLSLV